MRRTQSRQLSLPLLIDAPISLAALSCEACGTLGVTVIAIGRDGNGAYERCWCATDCARTAGWPWLASERLPSISKAKAHLHGEA